jgi:hypothetical protein
MVNISPANNNMPGIATVKTKPAKGCRQSIVSDGAMKKPQSRGTMASHVGQLA